MVDTVGLQSWLHDGLLMKLTNKIEVGEKRRIIQVSQECAVLAFGKEESTRLHVWDRIGFLVQLQLSVYFVSCLLITHRQLGRRHHFASARFDSFWGLGRRFLSSEEAA